MRICFRPAAAIVLVGLTLVQVGCGGGKYDTPQATFRTLQLAANDKDMHAVCECLTTESQDTLAGMLVLAGGMLRMQGGSADVSAVLDKHGVTAEAMQGRMSNFAGLATPEGLRELATMVKDRQAFVGDMFTAMRTTAQGANFSGQFENQIAGELQDVKINGDTATAVVVTDKGKDPIAFHKTADGWKLHIEMPGMGGAAPPA